MTVSDDPARNGLAEQCAWGATSAESWLKWFDLIEGGAQALSERMIDLAEVGPGQRILDVATGLGEPALSVARRIGPSGSVNGVDASADMLALARRRAAQLGLDNVEFRRMAGERLAYPEASFDALLCRWGLMFIGNLPGTLSGFRDSLAPGGRFVAAVWGPPDEVPALSLAARVVRRFLGMAAPAEGTTTAFAHADVAALRRSIEAAGFRDVRGEWISVEYIFETAATYAEFRKDRSATLRTGMADFPQAKQDAAWHAVIEAARQYEDSDGRVRMANAAYCVAARR